MDKIEYAHFKRCLEWFSVDPEFRKLMTDDPDSAVASLGFSGMVDPILAREAIHYHIKGILTEGKHNPYVAFFLDIINDVRDELVSQFSRDSVQTAQMFYYMTTQRNRVRMENSSIRKHEMVYYFPFALELASGCSVGCSFCGFGAGKLKSIARFTPENAELFRQAVADMTAVAGRVSGCCPLYYATEPLDNPDYELFLEEIRSQTGRIPQTTTAVADRCPERIKKMIDKISDEEMRRHALFRFSVRSIDQFKKIMSLYTPEELAYIEIIANNPESVNEYSASGRLFETEREEDIKNYSISCVNGIKINFARRDIEYIETEDPGKESPYGYRVLERRSFDSPESLHRAIMELFYTYSIGVLPLHRSVGINQKVTWSEEEETICFTGDCINYRVRKEWFLIPALMNLVTDMTFTQTCRILNLERDEANTLYSYLNELFIRGYLRISQNKK